MSGRSRLWCSWRDRSARRSAARIRTAAKHIANPRDRRMSERDEKKHHHHMTEEKKKAQQSGGAVDINRDAKADDPQEFSEDQAQKFVDALGRLQAEKDELMQTMVRRQADFENYRKRIERERDEDRRRGIERVLEDLVPVLDAFDRALRAHDNPAYQECRKGLELIYRQLWEAAARHGLERIAAAEKPFDPRF